LQSGSTGARPSDSPPPSLESNGSMPSGSPACYPDWNRYLEAAFHSPETIVRLRTTISRSTFPTYSFDAPPSDRRARSVSDSLARSGSPRRTQDRYRKPVARLSSGSHDCSSDLHFPLGSFGPIRIKAFNPIPGRKVHLLNTLDCPSLPGYEPILLATMPDHRSGLASCSAACCAKLFFSIQFR